MTFFRSSRRRGRCSDRAAILAREDILMVGLVDPYGRPLSAAALKREEAAPTLTGVRQILAGHPSFGLTPERLARILREAAAGDATRYLELSEDMEEKDLHYLGVLGTRKRAIAQLRSEERRVGKAGGRTCRYQGG